MMKRTIIGMLLFCFLCSCVSEEAPKAEEKKPLPPLPPLSKTEQRALKLLGGKLNSDGNIQLGLVTIDRRTKELYFPAEINMWEGDLEVICCGKAGRRHESLLVSDVNPKHLQLALILAGARNGSYFPGGAVPQGTLCKLDVVYRGKRQSIDSWVLNGSKEKLKTTDKYVFVGSSFDHLGNCLATKEGSLVDMNSQDQNAILRLWFAGDDELNDVYQVAMDKVPQPGSQRKDSDGKLPGLKDLTDADYDMPVKVIITLLKPAAKNSGTKPTK